VLLGEEFMHKFNARSSFLQKLVFFPNVSDGGQYRMNFDASLVTPSAGGSLSVQRERSLS
jgi:hypothetical protein